MGNFSFRNISFSSDLGMMTNFAQASQKLPSGGRLQRVILVVNAVLCAAIAATYAMAVLGNFYLSVYPQMGFDGSPLPGKYMIVPAVGLVAGLLVVWTSTHALRGRFRRGWLLTSLGAVCLLNVIEAALHFINLERGGTPAFPSVVAVASILWWLLILVVTRTMKE